jgi:hypothetical protein
MAVLEAAYRNPGGLERELHTGREILMGADPPVTVRGVEPAPDDL